MALFTLRKMAAGGMHDHSAADSIATRSIATGTSRTSRKCSTTRRSLPSPISTPFRSRSDRQYEAVARDILDYVARDMTEGGGFFSAEDADSPVVAGDRRNESAAMRRDKAPKAHSTSGRKRKSTRRWAMPPRFSISITAWKRTATRRKEAIRRTNSAARIF